ncbi:hypothetical protein AGMMS50249_1470 [candidate division SR1 bacterium]|nr:hypothetical protein AGMMS50249_1470 [candidate division SR1 bacterium]
MTTTLQNIIADGPDQLHILADFDSTLTRAFVNGKKSGALIQILYHEGYLTEHYQQQANVDHDYYLPIEKDETLSFEYRKAMMQEWWTKHKSLLVAEGLTKDHIIQAMHSSNIQLRDGYQTFFSLLYDHHIPLVILSAGGLGTLSIQQYLENQGVFYDNISLIGNEFTWDQHGKAIGRKEPLIHSLNKDETILQAFPEVYSQIESRKNVILLGDNPNDTKMIDGFDYKNLIKIGFLNSDTDKYIDKFREVYDIVITDDGNLDAVNEMLEEIVKNPR